MRPGVLFPVAVLVLFAIPAAVLVLFPGEAVGDQPSANPFPAVFELSSLLPANGGTGATGFVLNGVDVSGFSGASVSSAGDVNGDGVDDLIIGAPGASPNGVLTAGQSYVVFGGVGVGAGGTIEQSSLDGISGFVINGNQPCQESGLAVSSAGDVNGDGIDDLMISEWNDACNEAFGFRGRGYVIFGGTDVGAGGTIELSSLDGANGFVVTGGCDVFSVSSAGDVNGDGIDDVIMGAPPGCVYCPCSDRGGDSYVIFGGPDVGGDGQLEESSLDGTNGFVLHGVDAFDNTGYSVSSAGDVNGDGIDDLIIGATSGAPNGNSGAGESYVVFGSADVGTGGTIELSSLDGVIGFVINGIDAGDRSGGSVAGAGDVNDDGVDDLLIGAAEADPNGNSLAGESYVVFGGAGLGAGGVMELSSLDGVNGFVINGIDAGDRSGGSVAGAGDVNGDGIPDLLIGATGGDPNGVLDAGESYVVFGGTGLGAGGVIQLSSLDGVNGFVLSGIDADDFSGRSVASAGDVNGDGIADLLIGATGADPNGNSGAGESYVVFGRRMNRPPECPSTVRIDLWPPDHRYEELDLHEIVEVSDPDGDAISFSIEGIAQDESPRGRGDENTSCDAEVSGDSTFRLRRERRGGGDGRVYTVDYMAHDGKGGACRGRLEVGVSADLFGGPAVNGGALVDSLACDFGRDRFPR